MGLYLSFLSTVSRFLCLCNVINVNLLKIFQRDYLKRCLNDNSATTWRDSVLQEDRLDSVVLLFYFFYLVTECIILDFRSNHCFVVFFPKVINNVWDFFFLSSAFRHGLRHVSLQGNPVGLLHVSTSSLLFKN